MPPPRLAILLSGGGSTLQNLLDRQARGEFPLEIALVVASRPDALGASRARAAGLPTAVESDPERVFARVRAARVDWVILAGWMHLLAIPGDYARRVLNVHPSLLPAFGGRGMYGHRVHKAVYDSGVKVTGCTVHFADDGYDTGPVVAQQSVAVTPDDTPESIGQKVQAVEREVYPKAILDCVLGRWELRGRRFVPLG